MEAKETPNTSAEALSSLDMAFCRACVIGLLGPHLLPFDVDRQIDRFLSTVELRMDDTAVAFLGMAMILSENDPSIVAAGSPAVWRYRVALPAIAGRTPIAAIDEDVELNANAIAAMDPRAANIAHFLTRLLAVEDKKKKWLLSLAACHQVHQLNENHVKNFFKQDSMNVNGAALLSLIRHAAGHFPKLVEDPEMRAFIGNSNFIKYHTRFSASANIISQMHASISTCSSSFRNDIFTDETWNLVQTSVREYWSKAANEAIPMRLKGIAAIWAQVNNFDFGNWKQGKVGITKLRPGEAYLWRCVFSDIKSSAAGNVY